MKKSGRVGGWVGTRLIEWFLRQPEAVQTVVLDDVDDGLRPAYAGILRQMADQLDPPKQSATRPAGTPLIEELNKPNPKPLSVEQPEGAASDTE